MINVRHEEINKQLSALKQVSKVVINVLDRECSNVQVTTDGINVTLHFPNNYPHEPYQITSHDSVVRVMGLRKEIQVNLCPMEDQFQLASSNQVDKLYTTNLRIEREIKQLREYSDIACMSRCSSGEITVRFKSGNEYKIIPSSEHPFKGPIISTRTTTFDFALEPLKTEYTIVMGMKCVLSIEANNGQLEK